MPGIELLIAVTLLLVSAGALERWLHRTRLSKIPIRVHVNGTRGKSSVVRLIAAGLRAGGKRTCAKTTGTLARMILPSGQELPIYRPAGANIIEQKRIVAKAVELKAEALVIECMALRPNLQSLCELELIRATHGVITNARADHLEVMGPDARGVARALSGMVPPKGKLFTTETEHLAPISEATRDRNCELLHIGLEQQAKISQADLAGFSYTEHRENVALALAVCEALGVPKAVALPGMWGAMPDPGAMTEHRLDFFGRQIVFVNGFAANDPESTHYIWSLASREHAACAKKIAVFNCRMDRPERSADLARDFHRWPPADHIVLMGTGTFLFAREAARAGLDSSKFVFAEGLETDELFERIISLITSSALVMGLGNVGGQGLSLVRYFHNRSSAAQSGEELSPLSRPDWTEAPESRAAARSTLH